MKIFNNESEYIKTTKNTFGKTEYSGIGIINPTMIYVNNTKYNNSFLEYGVSNHNSILLYSIWHYKLKPFNDIFTNINYSKNITIVLNNTNIKINPLDIYYYVSPEIYIDIFILIFMIPFYYVIISIARKK